MSPKRSELVALTCHFLDDALSVRTQADMPAEKVRFVAYQCGFEPMVVAVWSYLGIMLEEDEAEEIASDYLREIGWLEEGADIEISVY